MTSSSIFLVHSNTIDYLKDEASESCDSLITDPPAGIFFMNKRWDDPDGYLEKMREIYKECLRVLKPGAHGLVWAIPRTSHWTATALEQSGFEIRDVITHVFGSGFPKSLDVSKAIDKAAGANRELGPTIGELNGRNTANHKKAHDILAQVNGWDKPTSVPATPEAKQWQGWGTALKPASEHWILVRKPLSEPTVAKNMLKHRTGGINVDESRIEGIPTSFPKPGEYPASTNIYPHSNNRRIAEPNSQGRFPANFVLSHNEDCDETCTKGCAVKMLDEQSGILHPSGNVNTGLSQKSKSQFGIGIGEFGQSKDYKDKGGASRFFYCAKASKRDRGETNNHPTVKATKLMEYLIKLITPPNGIILDPFMGSGSTGVAAKRLGFGFVGIEKELEYFQIAQKRIQK